MKYTHFNEHSKTGFITKKKKHYHFKEDILKFLTSYRCTIYAPRVTADINSVIKFWPDFYKSIDFNTLYIALIMRCFSFKRLNGIGGIKT